MAPVIKGYPLIKLVPGLVRIIVGELNLSVATPDEAREILHIG